MKKVALRSGVVTVVDVPPPTCSDNEVLVANVYSAISVGTELSTVMGSRGYSLWNVLKDPSLIRKASRYIKKRGIKKTLSVAKEFREASRALGYSAAGIVIALGKSITDIGVGNRVACAGGKANHTEIVSVPRNLVAKIPESVSFEEAAFTALGAIAMHGVRRADIQFGESIVIFGVGLIGQLAVQIAKAAGCRVIAIDKNPKRVDLAVKRAWRCW